VGINAEVATQFDGVGGAQRERIRHMVTSGHSGGGRSGHS
jgi:hypothetical protein